MATRKELGEMFKAIGGLLEVRFTGTVLYMVRQILDGGYGSPTQAQTDWANYIVGATYEGVLTEARAAWQWGLVNNATLQTNGETTSDTDLDYITAEYAKTYTP